MHANAHAVLEVIKERVAPLYRRDIREKVPALAEGDVDEFAEFMTAALDQLFSEVANVLGVTLDQLSDEVVMSIRGYLVAFVNGILDEDHPYIVSLVWVENEQEWKYFPLVRRNHGGVFHELISRNIIPLIVVNNVDEVVNGKFEITIINDEDDEN